MMMWKLFMCFSLPPTAHIFLSLPTTSMCSLCVEFLSHQESRRRREMWICTTYEKPERYELLLIHVFKVWNFQWWMLVCFLRRVSHSVAEKTGLKSLKWNQKSRTTTTATSTRALSGKLYVFTSIYMLFPHRRATRVNNECLCWLI